MKYIKLYEELGESDKINFICDILEKVYDNNMDYESWDDTFWTIKIDNDELYLKVITIDRYLNAFYKINKFIDKIENIKKQDLSLRISITPKNEELNNKINSLWPTNENLDFDFGDDDWDFEEDDIKYENRKFNLPFSLKIFKIIKKLKRKKEKVNWYGNFPGYRNPPPPPPPRRQQRQMGTYDPGPR